MMRNIRGLTIFEVLVVLGILAIVSAFAVPNVMNWRRGVQLRGAANNLKGDLELAKVSAIRENNYVAIMFLDALRYEVFVDNGAGDGGVSDNWVRDGEERLLRAREMPPGVVIANHATLNFGTWERKTRFTGRGHCVGGTIFLQNEKKDGIEVVLNRLGQITLKKP